MKKLVFLAILSFVFVSVAFGQITTFPWTEDFEGLDFLPIGWSKIVQTGNDITQSSTQNHTTDGSYSARFSSYSTSSDYNQYLFSPAVTVDAGSTELTFWHRKENFASEVLEWGIATDTDPLNYTWTAVTLSDIEWQETEVDLSAYVGQTVHIGFHYYGNYYYYVYLDDVKIDAPPSDPIFSINPESWDFGDVDVDNTASRTFTVSNSGAGSLGITSIQKTAGDVDYFEITNNGYTAPLGPGESFTFDVEFTPTETIEYILTVTITDDQDKATHEVPISGTGYTRPPGSTCDNPLAVTLPLDDFVDDTALYGDDYSNTWITPSSPYLDGDDMVLQFTLDVASTLEGTLTAVTGNWIGMFVLDTCPHYETAAPVLRSATTSGTSVTMTPVDLAAGTYFLIISSWPAPQSFQFSLDLSATPMSTNPVFSITPTSYDFGVVNLSATASKTFTVSNSGAGSLEITEVAFTAGDTEYFSILNNTYTDPLGFDESFTFDVQFAPTVVGDFSVTLTVTDNLSKVSHDVPITGTGYEATVYPPYSADFANWPVLDWTQLSFFYGETPATGYDQWVQDDWLNVTDPLNPAAKINIYGSTRHGWLITPPIDFGARGDFELVFDAGLVAWNQTTPPTGTQDDDRFIVFISDDPMMADPVILREWNNTGSTFVFNDIPATGATFTIPISGVTGIKYIAFYGESTVSGNGDNDLMVDNVNITAAQEPPTPVELSSFTATTTAQSFVQISWTSQSESQMVGYRVYRNISNDPSGSSLIDHDLIPATNTSTAQTYSIVDEDVGIGSTYYYWLEAVDYQNSNFHGPVSVLVEGNVPPVLPESTSLKSAFPNPFRARTNIEVGLKAGETGTVTIYNVHGQVVKSFAVTQGYHTLNWDGRDANNNTCASGIYFYKLSTPSFNQTMKMMLIK